MVWSIFSLLGKFTVLVRDWTRLTSLPLVPTWVVLTWVCIVLVDTLGLVVAVGLVAVFVVLCGVGGDVSGLILGSML